MNAVKKQALGCLILLPCLLVSCPAMHAQVFYYSGGKRITLREDSNTILIRYRDNHMPCGNMRITAAHSRDTLSWLLYHHPDIRYAWRSLTLGAVPFIPTGRIILKAAPGITTQDIIKKLQLDKQVAIVPGHFYDMSLLQVKDSAGLFNIANA